ncbi:MAG: prepilin-type N-terminal cleavage/methylation domain-containing protein [bacterium]|nr:prepilin-type N-terminal cleavage/methylation domain-containing protein [bacterium]
MHHQSPNKTTKKLFHIRRLAPIRELVFKLRQQRGFTLVEILVAMSITVVVAILITQFIGSITEFNQRFNRTLVGQEQASQTLQIMIPEIRSAAQSNVGNYPIEEAATSSFTFYSDIDKDGLYERVRYYLDSDGETFSKSIIKPSGEPLTYSSSSEITRPMMTGIQMGTSSIFTYYDMHSTGTQSVALPAPVDVLEVKTVNIRLIFDEGSTERPVIKSVENQATVRNLRFKDTNEQI